MQALTWYWRRLQAMSTDEVRLRVVRALRALVPRRPVALARPASPQLGPWPELTPGFRVTDVEAGEWASAPERTPEATWRVPLVAAADRIAAHRLTLFGQERHLGDPIDWNTDHESGRRAPLRRSRSIDYRDPRVAGDAKLVWELNRHHHLVVLGRAYRASGDLRYAQAAIGQWESWLEQCPFGQGMNWRSPLELAVRLINWVWAIDLLQGSGLVAGELGSRLLDSARAHLHEISRNYSHGSSANNHRIGEAAGVFVASSYFTAFAEAERWREESREIVAHEALAQTYPDGGTREQALGYHTFVLQFLLVAGLVARLRGEDMPSPYWARVEAMMEFLAALAEGGDRVPMFGDSDDGYVLDLGGPPSDPRALLGLGAVLFGRADFSTGSPGQEEPVRWLLGRDGLARLRLLKGAPAEEPIRSRAFPETGYYLLQSGADRERLSVVFDCGELGLGSLAAHGHADALSFTLRAFGKDVFVDPGTYDYFSLPAWREYFRSTRAHNTVVIDGADQSKMLAPFLWGARARARCLSFSPGPDGGSVSGQHDGYRGLSDPVLHRRTLDLRGRALTITDEIVARRRHDVAVSFHLGEECRVRRIEGNRCGIEVDGAAITLEIDPRLSVDAVAAGEGPGGGWVSRGYHQRVPSTTIVGRGISRGNTTFVCRVAVGQALDCSDGGDRRASRSEVRSHGDQAGSSWDRTGRCVPVG